MARKGGKKETRTRENRSENGQEESRLLNLRRLRSPRSFNSQVIPLLLQVCMNGVKPTARKKNSTVRYYRGRELNPNIFFSNFSGASGISRQNPRISRQKSLIPWVSRDIPNFLAPTPSCGRPPPHQKISGLKSLGLGSFFVPDISFGADVFPDKFGSSSCQKNSVGHELCFQMNSKKTRF